MSDPNVNDYSHDKCDPGVPFIENCKPTDPTKPTHISTSEDDVAKVIVDMLRPFNERYMKEEGFPSVRALLSLGAQAIRQLAKERDDMREVHNKRINELLADTNKVIKRAERR